jgi:uncharacterized membrane protein YpjA
VINPVKLVVDLVYGHKLLLAFVILTNIIGSLFGLYYYWGQLSMTPWYYWLFVPDCPLYMLLMIFALLFIAMGKRYNTFNVITAVGLAMYGAWTMFVLIFFREVYFAPENALMSATIWVCHGYMALESVLLLPYIRKAVIVSWLIAWAWFLVQTFFDYFIPFTYAGLPMRLHPLAILEYYTRGMQSFSVLGAKLDTMMYITFAMTLGFTALMIFLSKAWGFMARETEKTQST